MNPSFRSILTRLVVRHYLAPGFRGKNMVPKARKSLERLSSLAILPRGTRVKPQKISNLSGEWVFGPGVNEQTQTTLLYFHGGGFYCGSPATHRELVARISGAGKVRALSPDYRLAPEHPYPAANEDCLAAYDWLLAQGIPPKKIALGGDSAGGCLVLMTLLAIKESKRPMPGSAVLLSPLTDSVNINGDTMKTRKSADPWFKPENLPKHMKLFHGHLKQKPPILSPARQDLSGLPPLFVQTGDQEILLSDSTRLARQARKSGVEVQLEIWDYMWHVFQSFGVAVPEAKQAINNIGEFLRHTLSR